MYINRKTLVAIPVSLLVIILSMTSTAFADNNKQEREDKYSYHEEDDYYSHHKPEITSVRVDFLTNEINITGHNLTGRRVPGVELLDSGVPLSVCNTCYDENYIVASFVGVIEDGDYKLEISRGRHSRHKNISYDLTIGAVGPEGVQGEVGPQGIKGDTGAQGSKGDKGDTGAQGPIGDKGDTGAQGPRGLVGAQGPKGDKGDTGAQGPRGLTGPRGDSGLAGYQRRSRDSACPALNTCSHTTICPSGKKVLAGGVHNTQGGLFGVNLRESYPASDSSWAVLVDNDEPFVSRNLRLWVVCANTN